MAISQVEAVFKVLSDRNRIKLVRLLGQKERTVGELEKLLRMSQSSTSQHLKLLKNAGLVSSRKHGNFRIYSLRAAQLRDAMGYFDNLWDESLKQMKAKLEGDEE